MKTWTIYPVVGTRGKVLLWQARLLDEYGNVVEYKNFSSSLDCANYIATIKMIEEKSVNISP